MKRVLPIYIIAILLLSCSKDVPNGPIVEQRSPISFGDVSTRVNSASDINEFGVFIGLNIADDNEPGAKEWLSILESERVYRGSDGFTYDTKCYWVDNRAFFFLGYYPYGTNVTCSQEQSLVTLNGVEQNSTTSTYTMDISIPYAANTDFMTAQRSVHTADSGFKPTVDMVFSHLLSMVSFTIKKDADGENAEDKFVVTQLGLSGVSRTGKFTAVHTDDSYTEEFIWNDESRQIQRNNINVELTTGGVNILGENNGLMVMPQSLVEGDIMLNISYTYQQKGTDEVLYNTKSVAIPTSTVNKWVAGKKYMYSLILDVDNSIYINTPTMVDWGTPQPGGIVIIK